MANKTTDYKYAPVNDVIVNPKGKLEPTISASLCLKYPELCYGTIGNMAPNFMVQTIRPVSFFALCCLPGSKCKVLEVIVPPGEVVGAPGEFLNTDTPKMVTGGFIRTAEEKDASRNILCGNNSPCNSFVPGLYKYKYPDYVYASEEAAIKHSWDV